MTVNFSSHLFLFGGYLLELRIHNLDLFFSIINLATKKPPPKKQQVLIILKRRNCHLAEKANWVPFFSFLENVCQCEIYF